MPDLFKRRVKIVCTLGPSTENAQTVKSLILEGMDVARLNFSHGTHEFHQNLFKRIHTAAKECGKAVGVLQDLQGPKLRIGKIKNEDGKIHVKNGDILLLHPDGKAPSKESSKSGRIPIPIDAEVAERIAHDLKPQARVLFNDGAVSCVVVAISPPEIEVEVLVGGVLSSNKGMNLPGTPLPRIASITPKDIQDLKLGLKLGVDFVALSFVRSPDDIEELRKLIKKNSNYVPLLVSKIEREEAIDRMEEVMDVSDAMLVARGDMAVEIGASRVPIVQKRLISACNEVGVPVITATQMLESMIFTPSPTRAEASDVANAVFDGTDAVMLSGETASGQFPIEAVRMMNEIVADADQARQYAINRGSQPVVGSIVDSVEYSASKIAAHTGAVAIACLTHTGSSVRVLSKYRPDSPVVAITDSEEILRKLSIVWGARGLVIPEIAATDDVFILVEDVLRSGGWAKDGDLVVITVGVPTLRRGTTNTIKVHEVGAPMERGPRAY